MPDQAGTLEMLANELANVLLPVSDHFNDENLLGTLAQLGIVFPEQLINNQQFKDARSSLSAAAKNLDSALKKLAQSIDSGNEVNIIVEGLNVLNQCRVIISAFDTISSKINIVGPTMPGITAAQVNALTTNLPRKLLDMLVVDIMDIIPAVGNVMTLFGIIERIYHPGDDTDITKPDYEEIKVHYDRIWKLISSPKSYFETIYDWGKNTFDGQKLLKAMYDFTARSGLPASYSPPSVGSPAKLHAFAVEMTTTTSTTIPGIEFKVILPLGGSINFTIPLGHPAWSAEVSADATISSSSTAVLTPPFNLELNPGATQVDGKGMVKIKGKDTEPFIVLGQAGGSRLEVGSVSAGIGLKFKMNVDTGKSSATPLLSGDLKSGKLVIDASKGDGFLSKILSGVKAQANFDLGFDWSMSDGIRFVGSSTLEIQLPVHINLGPVSIPTIYLLAGFKDGKIPFEISATIGANLGVLKAVVERMGMLVSLSFPQNGGNVGPAQLDFAFKPPNGVGLSVDAGVIKGGGYLYFDFDNERYAGALELVFSEFISLKAIGLITTRMPDGSKGFSLLIIITAEFGATGIQLGYGFTLLGVGGLLGLNRTMKLQPLMTGVRTGAVNSIMFPTNIIENAPRIISDLRTIFPPEKGKFLIGPMAKLGWGTPTLISISLGVIIEIPGNIAIIGVLKIALPDERVPLIVLQVNFAGAIEFDKRRLYFFAALFESRVIFITLEGEMGLLVAWGNDANFVVSVGGFHPQFNPPPLPFPGPKRLALKILDHSNARIQVQGYFAVTSNTVQFGAKAEMYFGFSSLNIQGHIGFDALMQFSPFYFIIQVSGSVSLKVFGCGLFSISLKFSLEGPSNWRAKGKGSIRILFFKVSASFDMSWGEAKNTTLPPIDVVPVIKAEFSKNENWTAHLHGSNNLLVSLRKLDSTTGELVLHPVGYLRVSQKAVPIDLPIAKLGSQKVKDVKKFSLSVVSTGLTKKGDVKESFAMAQFLDLENSKKLSSPAYESQNGGLEISVSDKQLRSSKTVKRLVRYETKIVDTNFKQHLIKFFAFVSTLFKHFLVGSAVTKSELSYNYKNQKNLFNDKIKVKPESYSIAFNENNKRYSDETTSFSSYAAANAFMQAEIEKNPNLEESLHVIPNFELSDIAA